MVTYIYFVKCPNCEPEHFDFFDDAKSYAMGCMSQKPIITQTEVCRNDFGECTDSSDLGQVWSWEDECEPEVEPTTFSKDDIGEYDPDNDPEFQDDDDFRMINEELLESRRISFNNKEDQQEFFKLCKETGMITGYDLDRFMQDYEADDSNLLDKLRAYKAELDSVDMEEGLTEAKRDLFHEAIFEAIDYLTEFSDIFPVPENIGAKDWAELKDDINYGLSSDFEIAEIIMEYMNKDLEISRKHPEMFEDDPQSELTLETYNRLKRAYDRAVAEYESKYPEDFEESCKSVKEDFISVYDYGRMTKTELYDHLIKGDEVEIDIGDRGYTLADIGSFSDGGRYSNSILSVSYVDGKFTATEFYMSDDGDTQEGDTIIETDSFEDLWVEIMDFRPENLVECSDRKPIPEGMTIEDLVEEMEKNEDDVECTWCNDLFDKSECRYEVDLGWLCSRCEMAIKSRGETLTFREGNYWDFLDEETDPKKENLTEATRADYEIEYDSLTATVVSNVRDADDWDEHKITDSYTLTISRADLANIIWENFLTEEDVADVPGGMDALYADNTLWETFLDENLDKLFDKYYEQLKEYLQESAEKEFDEYATENADDYLGPDPDAAYDEYRDRYFDAFDD